MSGNVLARKLQLGGVARSPLPETDQIGETFARFIEEALRPLVKTTISAMLLETRVMKLAEALQDVSVPAMLSHFEVEGSDTGGLISLDSELAYHLADLMLGGDAAQAPAAVARSFTSIDMALGRLQQEAILEAFTKAMAAPSGKPLARAMRIGQQNQNVAQLRFAPGYIDILLFNIALDIGEAARTGNCTVFVPLSTLDVIRAAARGASDDRARRDDLWGVAMRVAAAQAPVRVDAVLHRQSFTLGELHRLTLGDVIPVPMTSVGTVALTIDQPGGKGAVVAQGRLGGYRQRKVVKLTEDVDPRLVQHVRGAL